jgi:O-antigen/teichoic acid export membrane protein
MLMESGIGPPKLGRVVLMLVAIIPFTLLWDFARRIAFAHLQMTEAVVLDTALALLQLGLLLLLASWESLQLETALGGIAVATAVVGLAWLFVLRKQFVFRLSAFWRDWRQNWDFGRWLLAGQLTGTLHGYAVPLILTLTIGAAATGIFVAGQMIVLLSNPLVLGLGNWLGPKTAQAYAAGGIRQVKATTWTATAAISSLMALFALGLFAFGDELLGVFFGEQYTGHGLLIAVLGVCTIAWGATVAVTCGLVALEQSRAIFLGTLLGLIVTLALVVPFGLLWHLVGAAVALLVGSFVTTVFLIVAFIWLTHRRTAEVASR